MEYDAAIIGGGSAGYAAARTCAAAGLKTVVIEGGKEVGGLCILRGCMPTKALLHSAEVLHTVRHAATNGIQTGEVAFRLEEIIARKDKLIQEFADYRRGQLESKRFDFIRANVAVVTNASSLRSPSAPGNRDLWACPLRRREQHPPNRSYRYCRSHRFPDRR